jgi:hypothetical protein
MTTSTKYEAFWVPGLGDDVDRDESLAVGLGWLAEAEREYCGHGVIVMYARKMMGNAPLLAQAASRWEFVSPRTRGSPGRGPVPCVWPPDDRVLELGEFMATRSALCVIPGSLYDISGWVRRTGAECLVEASTSLRAWPFLRR